VNDRGGVQLVGEDERAQEMRRGSPAGAAFGQQTPTGALGVGNCFPRSAPGTGRPSRAERAYEPQWSRCASRSYSARRRSKSSTRSGSNSVLAARTAASSVRPASSSTSSSCSRASIQRLRVRAGHGGFSYSFRAPSHAARTLITINASDGRHLQRLVAPGVHRGSVPAIGYGDAVTVTVRGVRIDGVQGPATSMSARIKPPTVKTKHRKHHKAKGNSHRRATHHAAVRPGS
jgi:hypothetical protein